MLLAKVTDDVQEYLNAVADDLRSAGFTVLPEEDYPDDRRRFEERFKADLTRADLFVQLLGQRPANEGAQDTGDPSLPALQFDEAKRVGVRVRQWAGVDVDPSKAPSGSYQRLLEGPDVRVMTLNEFKKTIKEELRERSLPGSRQDSGIYIAADQTDNEYAQKLKKVVIDLGFKDYEMILGNPANLKDLKDVIETAYAFVLLQGHAEAEFITNWLSNYRRLRFICKKHPAIEALVYAPPPREDKNRPPDVSFEGLDLFLPPEAFPQKDFEKKLGRR